MLGRDVCARRTEASDQKGIEVCRKVPTTFGSNPTSVWKNRANGTLVKVLGAVSRLLCQECVCPYLSVVSNLEILSHKNSIDQGYSLGLITKLDAFIHILLNEGSFQT